MLQPWTLTVGVVSEAIMFFKYSKTKMLVKRGSEYPPIPWVIASFVVAIQNEHPFSWDAGPYTFFGSTAIEHGSVVVGSVT